MSEKYTVDKSSLVGIANAIRSKYDSEDMIAFTDFEEAISGISGDSEGVSLSYEIIEFFVTQDTAEAQEFDFTLVDGATNYEVLIVPKNWIPTKAQNYSILGRLIFLSNNVLTASYNGNVSSVQAQNCPSTIDAVNGKVTFGPCGGNYRFRSWIEYMAIIFPRKDFTV